MMRARSAVALACLVLSGSLATAGVLAEGVPAPTEVAIPVGHAGDQVEFHGHLDGQAVRLVFALGDPAMTLDRSGRLHSTLPLLQVSDRERQVEDPIVGGQFPEIQRRDWLDLASRDVVRRDRFGEQWTEGGGFAQAAAEFSVTEFGPWTPAGMLPAGHWLVGHQGQVVGEGDAWMRPCWPTSAGITWQDDRSAVIDVGQVDGHDAVRILDELAYTVLERGEPVRVSQQTTSTWSEASPYPLQVRSVQQVQRGTQAIVVVDELQQVAFTPGEGAAVPWMAASTDPGCQPPPAFEQSIGHYPEDGTGFPLPYPLGEALQAVESDATFAAYIAWKATHPQSRLVGYTFRAQDPAGLVMNGGWMFWFADGAEVFVVRSYRDAESGGQAVNQAYFPDYYAGQGDLPAPVGDDEFPQDAVTIAEVQRMWLQVSPVNLHGQPLDHVDWGINGPYSTNPLNGFTRDRRMDVSIVGHNAGFNPNGLGGGLYDLLWFNHTTRTIDAYWSVNFDGILPGPQVPSGSPPAPAFIAPEGGRPPWSFAALAGASLLVVLAAVLATPAAKNALAQLGLWGGFSKIADDEVLTHPARRALRDAVHAEPGISPPELATRLGMAWSTLVYHLGLLERRGFIVAVMDGHHKRLFPQGPRADHRAAAVLRNPVTADVHRRVAAAPGIQAAAIARALGVTPQAVAKHVRRLEDAGLLHRLGTGRSQGLHPGARAASAAA